LQEIQHWESRGCKQEDTAKNTGAGPARVQQEDLEELATQETREHCIRHNSGGADLVRVKEAIRHARGEHISRVYDS